MENKSITVETTVNAPMEKVWQYWTEPMHIMQWSHASDDWEAPHAENDLRVDGKFKTVLAAKDKSFSFDFAGVYTSVKPYELIEYTLGDDRKVSIKFASKADGVKITQTFDMENENSEELQRSGWQAFMDNFKKYTES